jgi:hypothetical protein
MCLSGRVLVDEDGNSKDVQEAIKEMETQIQQLQLVPAESSTSADAVTLPEKNRKDNETYYLKPKEYSDEQVMQTTLGRLQYETNIFYIDQYEKSIVPALKKKTAKTKPAALNYFLFVQTESSVADCRWQTIGTQAITDSDIPTPPTSLDRGFLCHMMTQLEFETEVVPDHPLGAFFNSSRFKGGFTKLFDKNEHKTHIVVLSMFGCGALYVGKLELPPWDAVYAQYTEQKDQFKDLDCVEIYIDRS